MTPLGFIGTGTMGAPIVRRLLDAGHPLVVFDLSDAAMAPLVEAGANRAASPAEVAAACRIVFTSLPDPAAVDAAVTGPGGILESAKAGDVHVDLSTSSFEAVQRLHRIEARAGVHLVDAPVSGGAVGAAQGTLSVMASGDADAYARVEPFLEAFSKARFHLGEPGTGTLTKLVNNLIFLCGGVLVQEALVLSAKAGLDTAKLIEVLKASSAAGYAQLAPLFASRAFDNVIFKLGIAEKDVALALQSARELGVPMPMTESGHQVYERACQAGFADEVFYATLKTLESAAGTHVPTREE